MRKKRQANYYLHRFIISSICTFYEHSLSMFCSLSRRKRCSLSSFSATTSTGNNKNRKKNPYIQTVIALFCNRNYLCVSSRLFFFFVCYLMENVLYVTISIGFFSGVFLLSNCLAWMNAGTLRFFPPSIYRSQCGKRRASAGGRGGGLGFIIIIGAHIFQVCCVFFVLCLPHFLYSNYIFPSNLSSNRRRV